jgi:hypothetical protein
VIALEGAARYADLCRVVVKLVDVDVAHHVAPPPAHEPPATLIDEHSHHTMMPGRGRR